MKKKTQREIPTRQETTSAHKFRKNSILSNSASHGQLPGLVLNEGLTTVPKQWRQIVKNFPGNQPVFKAE